MLSTRYHPDGVEDKDNNGNDDDDDDLVSES